MSWPLDLVKGRPKPRSPLGIGADNIGAAMQRQARVWPVKGLKINKELRRVVSPRRRKNRLCAAIDSSGQFRRFSER